MDFLDVSELGVARAKRAFRVEEALRSLPPELLSDFPVSHLFAPGLYLRSMALPAGSLISGAVHRFEHFCILLSGRVRVVGVGDDVEEFSAPFVFRGLPGCKRAVYALDDCVWMNVHSNPLDLHDLREIWDYYTEDV